MMSGEIVNTTEQRAVLHTALRDASGTMPEAIVAQEELSRAFHFGFIRIEES
jgi:glucose-6-phosphate isomerase